jgi:hypothetical protein
MYEEGGVYEYGGTLVLFDGGRFFMFGWEVPMTPGECIDVDDMGGVSIHGNKADTHKKHPKEPRTRKGRSWQQ